MGGGCFHTGNIAVVDEDGYFFIVDRKKDLIIRGGYGVYPRKLEEPSSATPAVREAAVIGVSRESPAEDVGAAAVLREGAHTTPGELRDYMKPNVAAYQ